MADVTGDEERCAEHLEEPSSFRCSGCERRLCGRCPQIESAEARAVCAGCDALARRPRSPRLFLAGGAVVLALIAAFAPVSAVWLYLLAGGFAGLAVGLGVRPQIAIVPEPAQDSPYRQLPAVRRAPRVLSGLVAASVLLGGLVVAVSLPIGLRLSAAAEVAALLAVWWLAWAASLARLAYAGVRLSRDFRWGARERLRWIRKLGDLPDWVTGFWEFVLAILLLLLAAVVLGLLIELVLPAIFFALYLLVLGGLRFALHARHGAHGHLPRALGFAAGWATLYTVPPALVALAVLV